MAVINTNISATIAQNSLVKNERMMSKAMEQLSTGRRINSAADDAAGLAITSKMTSQIRGLDMAIRNINDGAAMLQVADGAYSEIENMLQRMRELAVQMSNDTYSATERGYANTEFKALAAEIARTGRNTQYSGSKLGDGTVGSNGSVTFQAGANAAQSISYSFDQVSGADGASAAVSVDTAAADGTGAGQAQEYLISGTFTDGDEIHFAGGSVTVSVDAVTNVVSVADTLTGGTASVNNNVLGNTDQDDGAVTISIVADAAGTAFTDSAPVINSTNALTATETAENLVVGGDVAQITDLDLTSVESGDVLTLVLDDGSEYRVKVTVDSSTGLVTADTASNSDSAAFFTFGNDGATANQLQVTAVTAGTAGAFTISSVQVDRGIMSTVGESSIDTQARAATALGLVDSAVQSVSASRAELGATINRLQYVADNLANEAANTEAARSQILDADYATATTELARTQIIQQAGTAMLAQANQLPQTVLSLLQ